MNIVVIVVVMAIVVEALVEYVKTVQHTLASHRYKTLIVQASALAIAITLCLMSGADVFDLVDVQFSWKPLGCILTGVFASRGSNYMSNIIKRLENIGQTTTAVTSTVSATTNPASMPSDTTPDITSP